MACLLLLVGLVVFSGALESPASATTATVYGRASGPHNVSVKVEVGLFTRQWTWLRTVKTGAGGVYQLSGVKPGKYWLQFSDARPRWDIHSDATKDVSLTVVSGRAVRKDAHLGKGAFITGTVRAGHKAAHSPKIIATAPGGVSYTVRGNAKGQFALGGLPRGSYTVFFYDTRHDWSGKPAWVPHLKAGRSKNLKVSLNVRAAAYGGFLMIDGKLATGKIWVTAINRSSGQFWVKPVRKGDLGELTGLSPGRYQLRIPATSRTGAKVVALPRVKAGHTRTVLVGLTSIKKHRGSTAAKPSVKASVKASASASPSPSDTPAS